MAANLPAAAAPAVTGRAIPGEAGQGRGGAGPVAGRLDGGRPADDALLCVSELATNAVLHSRSGRPGGRFTVCAATRPGRVRVAVADEGGPWRPGRGGGGQSGRGLLIVGTLASRWGRDDGGAGR